MATAKRQELIGRLRELRGSAMAAQRVVVHGRSLAQMDPTELIWLIDLTLEEFASDARDDSLPSAAVEELKRRWTRLQDEADAREDGLGSVRAAEEATAARVLYHLARGLERKG